MDAPDDFTDYYMEDIEGYYDSPDRIVIKAFNPYPNSPGGFREWWRKLYGTDNNLDRKQMMRMAGRFGETVRKYAFRNNIPYVKAENGERKDEISERHLPSDPEFAGVFLIVVGRAQAPVWEVKRDGDGKILEIFRQKNWPYVNHIHFHIMDKEWGHVIVRMCTYPPFGALIILNGHEWVERTARRHCVPSTKRDNCFVGGDFQALNHVAKALRGESAQRRLANACDRWVYSACLVFGLSLEDQEKTGFRYRYSCYQVEYSRNLAFRNGRLMDEVYQGMIDRTRACLDIKILRTVFGFKRGPQLNKKTGSQKKDVESILERRSYDMTVFKVRWGGFTVKIYDKGERVLRFEVTVHNTKELRCGRMLECWPELIGKMQGVMDRFMNTVRAADHAFIGGEVFDSLPLPVLMKGSSVSGINMESQRMRAVIFSVMALATAPEGFTARELATKVQHENGWNDKSYCVKRASYDLRKLRARKLVHTPKFRHRYLVEPSAFQTLWAYVTIRDKVIRPLLAGMENSKKLRSPKIKSPIDQHYVNFRHEMIRTFETLGIAV